MSWEYEVEAFNTATESTNRMHDDAVARSFGFRGGLVPGVDVWAYLTGPCVDRWGSAFLAGGAMQVRFLVPVYDGELIVARLEDGGGLRATGPDGVVRAEGEAELAEAEPVRDLALAERPDDPPPAEPELLAPGTVLGTLRFEYRKDLGRRYLEDVRERRSLYEDGGLCHPGLLARQANYVLSRSVRLGPWIHVSTRARHRAPVRAGAQVEVRGTVTGEREHKGHRFVDLDVEISADGEPAWSASHTAIWRPRRRD